MEPAFGFSLDVIRELKRAIDESGISNTELVKRAEMSSDYFYVRMRGEKPFTTNDVSKIAEAIGYDAFVILRRAAAHSERREVTSVASQFEKIMRKKIEVEKAAYRDENKQAESGRGEDLD
jgi:hypothetical protein